MSAVDHVQVGSFGGLNTNSPKDQIGDNEFEIAENVVIRRGAVQKRKGAILRQDLLGEAKTYHHVGMVQSDQPNVIDMYLHDFNNHALYSTNSYVTDDASFITLSTNVKYVLSNIIGTGAGAYCIIQKTDDTIALVKMLPLGPSFTVISTNLRGNDRKHTWVFEHQDRLWVVFGSAVVGSDFDGTVIGYSDPGAYSTVSTLDTEEKTVRIPDMVTYEAQSLGDKIIFFGLKGIWVLLTQGSPRNWSLVQLDNNISIPVCNISNGYGPSGDTRFGFNQATLKYKNLIYFLALDGFYVTDGVTIQKLSDKVQNYFNVPIGTSNAGSASILTELCGIQVFDDLHDELIVKLIYSDNRPPKYFIYSITQQLWTEFKFGVPAPDTAPSKSAPYLALIDPIVLPYDYSFASMAYCYVGQGGGGGNIVPGFHLFSNYKLTEKNRVYNIRSNARLEEAYSYFDGLNNISTGTKYVSRIRTKNLDFGFRGINKKIVKNYFTIRRVTDLSTLVTPTPYTISLKFRRRINDIAMTDISLSIDSLKRFIKLAGPGYFIEYAIELLDDNNMAFWELQAIGFEIMRKPEQLATTGVSP